LNSIDFTVFAYYRRCAGVHRDLDSAAGMFDEFPMRFAACFQWYWRSFIKWTRRPDVLVSLTNRIGRAACVRRSGKKGGRGDCFAVAGVLPEPSGVVPVRRGKPARSGQYTT